MHKHNSTWTDINNTDNNSGSDNDTDAITTKSINKADKTEPYEIDYFGDGMNTAIATSSSWTTESASSIVAIDGMHPNDDEYDIWGTFLHHSNCVLFSCGCVFLLVKKLTRRLALLLYAKHYFICTFITFLRTTYCQDDCKRIATKKRMIKLEKELYYSTLNAMYMYLINFS
jgi:hypothetical protein